MRRCRGLAVDRKATSGGDVYGLVMLFGESPAGSPRDYLKIKLQSSYSALLIKGLEI
jgi:hypothetical protein